MWNTTLFFNYFLGWGTRTTFEVDKDEGFYQGTHKTFVPTINTTYLLPKQFIKIQDLGIYVSESDFEDTIH